MPITLREIYEACLACKKMFFHSLTLSICDGRAFEKRQPELPLIEKL